jgi:mono/diheme cytochrome c family protein
MLRPMLLIALAGSMAFAPLYARAESKLSLRTVNVDLPADDRMFATGRGSDATNNNCLACHSADMVLNQPAMSKAQWKEEIDKMRRAYKAPIDPKDDDPIADYLVGIRGAK